MMFLDLMEIEIRRAGKPLTIKEALSSASRYGTINMMIVFFLSLSLIEGAYLEENS